jgi:hypothetical protein
MEDKTLRIIFKGIAALLPGAPRNGDKPPDKAFVMMPANVEHETAIPEHFPFVCVDPAALENPPDPHDRTGRNNRGQFIYYFRDARVKLDRPKPGTRIEYFIDPDGRPLADRPGSDDVAPPNDIRWLADIRDILSEPVPLKKTAKPLATNIGDEVAAIVNFEGGTWKANFPCDSVHPVTFMDEKGSVVPGSKRVLADEFMIDIPYPADTERVTLSFQDLKKGKSMTGPEELVLKWPDKETLLLVRMGNDTKNEVRRLDTPDRCDPVRQIGPVLKPRVDDFAFHYNLLEIPAGVGLPLPQTDVHQCGIEDCKPCGLVDGTQGGAR